MKDRALKYHQQGRLEEAKALYENYLHQFPRDIDVLNMLATLESSLGNLDRAEELLDIATKIEPKYGYLYYTKAIIKLKSGDELEAQCLLEKAIKLDDSLDKAMRILGHLYQKQHNFKKAIEVLEKYKLKFTTTPEIELELGYNFQKTGRLKQAITCYLIALQIKPNADAYFNLAMCYTHSFAWKKAQKYGHLAKKINPQNLKFLCWDMYINKLNCDWENIEADKELLVDGINQKLSNNIDELPPGYVLNVLGIEDKLHAKVMHKLYQLTSHPEIAEQEHNFSEKIINIGYLSADFRNHAVGMLLAPLIKHHNRQRFSITGYSLREVADELNLEFKKEMDVYRDVSALASEQIASIIKDDKIDILVDLSGSTDGGRPEILSFHPAPIQIGLWGYLNSMGGDYWDYIITDKVIWPEDANKYYTEKPLFIEGSILSSAKEIPKFDNDLSKRQYGFPEDAIIVGSFNNSYKISQQWLSGWLSAIEKNKKVWLWLYVPEESIKETLLRFARTKKFDTNRLKFADKINYEDHLKRLRIVDLFADSFEYNAGATGTSTTLAGVPILTLKGSRTLARMGASINQHLAMNELICKSEEEYWTIAKNLIADKHKLHQLKIKLQKNIHKYSFGNANRFCKNLETLYEQAIQEKRNNNGQN